MVNFGSNVVKSVLYHHPYVKERWALSLSLSLAELCELPTRKRKKSACLMRDEVTEDMGVYRAPKWACISLTAVPFPR